MTSSQVSPSGGGGGRGIFLIGFMGSGKSYWGQLWAAKHNRPFFDLDQMIEEQEGLTVAAFFKKYGEKVFRDKETAILKSFSGEANFIVACGGGTPCFNDNIQLMNEMGTSIYLFANAQYLYERVSEEKDKRPLLKDISDNELLFFIEQKLKEREPFYQQAKIILPVTVLSAETILTLNF